MGGYNKRGYLNSDFKIFHLTDQISTEFEFHYHEFHKITIFISGNVQYFVEGKTYPLEPYDIVLVNRNDIHRVQVDPSLPYERIIVYISPGFIDAYRTDDYDLSYCFEKAKKEHSNVLRIHSLEKSSLFKITNRLERSFSDTEYAGSLYRQILFLEFTHGRSATSGPKPNASSPTSGSTPRPAPTPPTRSPNSPSAAA